MADEDVLRAIEAAGSFSGGGGSFGGSPTTRSSGSAPGRTIYLGTLTPRVTPTAPTRGTYSFDNSGRATFRASPGAKPGVKIEERVSVSDYDTERGRVFEWYGTQSFDDWGDYLVDLGLIDEEDKRDIRVLDEWWEKALDLSATFFERGKRINPRDALRAIAGVGADGKPGSGRSKGFTGTKTRTDRQVDLTDPTTARALVNEVLSQHLGRAATDEEIEAFRGTLNAFERANPTLSTTTAQYADGDVVSTNTTTSGGVTQAARQQLLADEAMELPEYGAYQAAATYFNALLGSLGTVGGN